MNDHWNWFEYWFWTKLWKISHQLILLSNFTFWLGLLKMYLSCLDGCIGMLICISLFRYTCQMLIETFQTGLNAFEWTMLIWSARNRVWRKFIGPIFFRVGYVFLHDFVITNISNLCNFTLSHVFLLLN